MSGKLHWQKRPGEHETGCGYLSAGHIAMTRIPEAVTYKLCLKMIQGLLRPRRIMLPLAKDTTATECGACPANQAEELGASCRIAEIYGWASRFTLRRLDAPCRLPECIAAEVK